MRESIKVSKTNKLVKAILASTFPEYKGRSIHLVVTDRVYIDQNGGGGTYEHAMALRIDGQVATLPRLAPWDGAAISMANEGVLLPEGMALVTHSHFCGKDMGITIHIAPSTTKLLPAGELPQLPSAEVRS